MVNVVSSARTKPTIVIDAVFFQLAGSGIARVWRKLFEGWEGTAFAEQILVLDRAGTAPKFPGLRSRIVSPFQYTAMEEDRQMLQRICDEEGASLFISSYYTMPLHTPAALMVYDMIPEVVGMDLSALQWVHKAKAIQQATHFISISKHTATDLIRLSPRSEFDVVVALCGCDFQRPSQEAVVSFMNRYRIDRPYFMLSGSRSDYKNAIQFFRAFGRLGDIRKHLAIVCTGGEVTLEPAFAAEVGEASVHMLRVDDADLQCAYAGAVALVYPSLYEGFGMPPLEAMRCGCPVITSRNASLPEVCGDAAIYVDTSKSEEAIVEMQAALQRVFDPAVRQDLISRGMTHSMRFSWTGMADTVATHLKRWSGQSAAARSLPVLPPDYSLQQAMVIAFDHYRAGEHDITRSICQKLLSDQVDHFYVYYLTGILAADSQEWERANDMLRLALERTEGIPEDRVADANARLQQIPQESIA
jgi:glycosyltransferase involved in cell wall biosynthesis